MYAEENLLMYLYILPYSVMGIGFAKLYTKTNNIYTNILIHFIWKADKFTKLFFIIHFHNLNFTHLFRRLYICIDYTIQADSVYTFFTNWTPLPLALSECDLKPVSYFRSTSVRSDLFCVRHL